MVGPMNPRARADDKGTLEMKTQDSIGVIKRFCGGNCGHGLGAGIADQGGQTARGAVAAMGSRNGAHPIRRRLIVEKNAAAPVDLQVDEARRKHRPGRHHFGWPVSRSLITRRDALNRPTIDQNDRIIVPAITIENTVGRDRRPGWWSVLGW